MPNCIGWYPLDTPACLYLHRLRLRFQMLFYLHYRVFILAKGSFSFTKEAHEKVWKELGFLCWCSRGTSWYVESSEHQMGCSFFCPRAQSLSRLTHRLGSNSTWHFPRSRDADTSATVRDIFQKVSCKWENIPLQNTGRVQWRETLTEEKLSALLYLAEISKQNYEGKCVLRPPATQDSGCSLKKCLTFFTLNAASEASI